MRQLTLILLFKIRSLIEFLISALDKNALIEYEIDQLDLNKDKI